MPERQSRHPDNDLIKEMQEEATPGHQGRSGGLATDNGTKAELERAGGADTGVTRVTGSDKGAQDAIKGEKTRDAIRDQASKTS